MTLHGEFRDGVIVLDDDGQLPEGARVEVIPAMSERTANRDETWSPEERRRVLAILDRIASLPFEGDTDRFEASDIDRLLYGRP